MTRLCIIAKLGDPRRAISQLQKLVQASTVRGFEYFNIDIYEMPSRPPQVHIYLLLLPADSVRDPYIELASRVTATLRG